MSCRLTRAPVSWPEIHAQRFVLEGDGEQRAILGLRNGTPVLSLYGNSGSSAEVTSESMKLIDKDGNARLALVLGDKGSILILADEGRKLGITIEPFGMKLRDNDGHVRAAMSAVDKGAGIVLYDSKDRGRLLMMTGQSGEPALHIMNAKQKTLWSVP